MCHPLWFPAATTAQLGPLRKCKKHCCQGKVGLPHDGFLASFDGHVGPDSPSARPRPSSPTWQVGKCSAAREQAAQPFAAVHGPSALDRLAPHTSLRSRPLSPHSIGQIVPTLRTRRALIPYRRYHSIVPGIVRRCQARGTTQVFTRSGVRNLVAPIDNRSVTSYDAANVLMNDAC